MKQRLLEDGYPLTSKYYDGIVGLARKLANKYGRQQMEEDFAQVALTSACLAEPKYNESMGASFYTYVNKIIKAEIQKHFGNPNRNTKNYKLIHQFIQNYDKEHGMYPDVQTISKGTKLSRFVILSVYYDKFREQQLDEVNEWAYDMTNPFDSKDFDWVMEHMDVLNKEEKKLIELVYVHEIPFKIVAASMKLSLKEANELREIALAKLKHSIETYE